MKTHLFLIIAFVLLTGSVTAQDKKASASITTAIYEEEVTGNLDKAVELYLDILKKYPNDRPVAAKTLYHLGLVNEKMGKQKASEYFTRLVNTYPDQTEMVSLAKEKLAALGSPGDNKGIITRRILTDASDIGGDLTADGKYINRMDRSNGDVIQFEVASKKVNRITNKGPWDEYEHPVETCVFSPDGKQIVYDRFNKETLPELRIRNSDGSGLRTLYYKKGSYVYPLAWAPDEDSVLVLLGEYSQMKEMALISTTNGSVRVLKNIASAPYMLNQACFSSDGNLIAFSMVRDGNPPHGDLFLMTDDGHNEVIIAGHPSEDKLLAWTPDGKGLIFLSDRSGTWDIWIVGIAGGRQQGEPELLKKDFGRDSGFIGISPAGSLYYNVRTYVGALYAGEINFETGKVLISPSQVQSRFTGPPFNLTWSPDGKYLLYLSRRGGIEPDYNIITIRSFETGEERFLSPGLRFVYDINWSPDGRSIIAYGISEKELGTFQIDFETGKANKLPVKGRVPKLCPDGMTLLYVSVSEGGAKIIKHNLNTGEESVVDKTGAVSYDLSPDGQKVVCSDDSIIKIVPLNGGEPKELIRGLSRYYSLKWTTDSHNIIARALDESHAVWRIPVNGGPPLKLDLSVQNLLFFALHPDNRSFALSVRDKSKIELWVLENFLLK